MDSFIRKILVENDPDNNFFFGLSEEDIRGVKENFGEKEPKTVDEIFESLSELMGDPQKLEEFIKVFFIDGHKTKDIEEVFTKLGLKEENPVLSYSILKSLSDALSSVMPKLEIEKKYIQSNHFVNNPKIIKGYEPIDLVLDFSNMSEVDEIEIDPTVTSSKEYFKQLIYKYDIIMKIFAQIKAKKIRCRKDFQYYDFVDKSYLLNTNQEDFIDEVRSSFTRTLMYLDLIGRENNSKIRLHVFLDSVEDPLLQEVINLIIDSKFVMVNGYSTKQDLITYSSPLGDKLPDNSFISYQKGPTYKIET